MNRGRVFTGTVRKQASRSSSLTGAVHRTCWPVLSIKEKLKYNMIHNDGMVTVFPTVTILKIIILENCVKNLVATRAGPSGVGLESERLKSGGIPEIGMRRTKCTPSFRREDERLGKSKTVRQQLLPNVAGGDNHTLKKQAGECRPSATSQ